MLNKTDQRLYLGLLILFLGMVFFIGSFLIPKRVIEIISRPAGVSENLSDQIPPIENGTITLAFVGDIMMDRGVKYMIERYGQGDFRFPFLKMVDDLKEADILFGNLEGPISSKGIKVGSIYSFRNNPKAIEGLTFASFDILSLANNHSFDYGREALEDTFLRLKRAGIDYVGAGFNEKEAYSPILKEINGTKIAFLAYTNLGSKTWRASENNPGIAWIFNQDFEKIKEDISLAKENSDILIVSLHAGEEYQREPNQFQIDFAKMAIGAGADLVIGHHPHVVQRNEKYKENWIFYSLGNFVFDQDFSEETLKGQLVKVLIKNSKIKEVVPINIKINEYFQPEIEK